MHSNAALFLDGQSLRIPRPSPLDGHEPNRCEYAPGMNDD